MSTVWVVYDATYERVFGVFSDEVKAADYAVKKGKESDREYDVGIYITWGEFTIDDENAKPLGF